MLLLGGLGAFAFLRRRRHDALPAHARAHAFLRAWTCKEAYVKATGEGLSLPLPRIAVALSGPARLLHVEGRGGGNPLDAP
jgi:4'-phosphopantetheinyl transferase